MLINAEKLGGPSTANDDPRITRTGKMWTKRRIERNLSYSNTKNNMQYYENIAKRARKEILNVIYRTKSPHIGSSLSITVISSININIT